MASSVVRSSFQEEVLVLLQTILCQQQELLSLQQAKVQLPAPQHRSASLLQHRSRSNSLRGVRPASNTSPAEQIAPDGAQAVAPPAVSGYEASPSDYSTELSTASSGTKRRPRGVRHNKSRYDSTPSKPDHGPLAGVFKVGDKIRVVKVCNQEAQLAVVIDPSFNGMVKVRMTTGGARHAEKTYLADELIHNACGFESGDWETAMSVVKNMKIGKQREQMAVVIDPLWHNIVRVRMNQGDASQEEQRNLADVDEVVDISKTCHFQAGDVVNIHRDQLAVVIDPSWGGIRQAQIGTSDGSVDVLEASPPLASVEFSGVDVGDGSPPASVEFSGRLGSHLEVNGIYNLSDTMWKGRPVYWHSSQESPLAFFHDGVYWTIAQGIIQFPLAVARWGPCDAEGFPLEAMMTRPQEGSLDQGPTGCWEFLHGEIIRGRLVTDHRTYAQDRLVMLRVVPRLAQAPASLTSLAEVAAK